MRDKMNPLWFEVRFIPVWKSCLEEEFLSSSRQWNNQCNNPLIWFKRPLFWFKRPLGPNSNKRPLAEVFTNIFFK